VEGVGAVVGVPIELLEGLSLLPHKQRLHTVQYVPNFNNNFIVANYFFGENNLLFRFDMVDH
jgi:hypothetical protein